MEGRRAARAAEEKGDQLTTNKRTRSCFLEEIRSVKKSKVTVQLCVYIRNNWGNTTRVHCVQSPSSLCTFKTRREIEFARRVQVCTYETIRERNKNIKRRDPSPRNQPNSRATSRTLNICPIRRPGLHHLTYPHQFCQ